MNDAAQMQMLALEEIPYPVSWRYLLQTPHGFSQCSLSADVPYLSDKPEFAAAVGAKLWESSLATASTLSTALRVIQTVQWKLSPVAQVQAVTDAYGTRDEDTAPADSTAVLVALTGHLDSYGRRRVFLPGTPASWVEDRMLTKKGAEGLQELARGMILGLTPPHEDKDIRWLTYYPSALRYDVAPFQRVGFRRVTNVRVCHYAERMPDLSLSLFP
jgi:hypothetical protein